MRSNNNQQPQLTAKEMVLMKMLWNNGPMFVREMLAIYPEPKPHFNTISTIIRILEEKGHVAHEVVGASHRYYAVSQKEDFSRRSLARVVGDYFNNSYKSVVSTLVKEEKISVDELREIIDLIDRNDNKTGS